MANFKKGDYVMCNYEGREYTGLILEEPKKNLVEVQICTSSRRAEKPILEQVKISIDNIKEIQIQ